MIPPIWFEAYAFFFGSILGSFANACIYRLPKDLSLLHPRSMCTRCGTLVAVYDNIPILSYFILRGRCRNCRTPYGIQYLFVEIFLACMALWIYRSQGFHFSSVYLFFLVTALVILSVIDLHHRIIPDEISIYGTWIGLAIALVTTWLGIHWWVTLKQSLLGMALGGGMLWSVGWVYEKITGREGIGFGDVKLLALFGAHTGVVGVITSIFYGSLLGSIVGIMFILIKNKNRKYPIPFGPFLSIGFALYLTFGSKAIEVPLSFILNY